MSKAHATTEMKYIDWAYLRSLDWPIKDVVDQVYVECRKKRLAKLMAIRCDSNEEIVAQFYATLYIDEESYEMHFTIKGKRFLLQFGELLGFDSSENTPFGYTMQAF